MARWLVLYSDDDGEPRQAVINDHSGSSMPYGTLADDAVRDLPEINTGGTVFILEMGDDPSDDPMVISNDQEIARQFVDI